MAAYIALNDRAGVRFPHWLLRIKLMTLKKARKHKISAKGFKARMISRLLKRERQKRLEKQGKR